MVQEYIFDISLEGITPMGFYHWITQSPRPAILRYKNIGNITNRIFFRLHPIYGENNSDNIQIDIDSANGRAPDKLLTSIFNKKKMSDEIARISQDYPELLGEDFKINYFSHGYIKVISTGNGIQAIGYTFDPEIFRNFAKWILKYFPDRARNNLRDLIGTREELYSIELTQSEQINPSTPQLETGKEINRIAPLREGHLDKWVVVWNYIEMKHWRDKGYPPDEIRRLLIEYRQKNNYFGPIFEVETIRKIIRAGLAGELNKTS